MNAPRSIGRLEASPLTSSLMVMVFWSAAAGQGFFEAWETAPLGRQSPIDVPAPVDAAFILGDEGW